MYFLDLFRPGPAWLADAPLEEQHWHAQGQPMPPAWNVPDGGQLSCVHTACAWLTSSIMALMHCVLFCCGCTMKWHP